MTAIRPGDTLPCNVEDCARAATKHCDYPIGHGVCWRGLCNAHAVPVGGGERDFCPYHQLKPEHTYQRELPL